MESRIQRGGHAEYNILDQEPKETRFRDAKLPETGYSARHRGPHAETVSRFIHTHFLQAL